MGYYCAISDESFVEARFDWAELDVSRADLSQHMASLGRNGGVLQTPFPFQIILMGFAPSSPVQIRVSVMSPGVYNYMELEQQALAMHQHNTFELVYIREGTLYQRIESERHVYPAGSFFLLNRNVRHCEEADSAFSTVSLSLSGDFFRSLLLEDRDQVFKAGHLRGDNTDLEQFLSAELLGAGDTGKNYIDFIPLHPQKPDDDTISDLFEQMSLIMLAPKPGDIFAFRALICRLLNLLCRRDLFSTRPIRLGTQAESRIFTQITLLMEENKGRISREKLVEKLRYSGSYLNRIVQTYTGMNITQYALHLSLEHAAHMLRNTDSSVTEIVNKLGFSNRTYFYTEFHRHYEMTPREYRLRNKH